MSVILEIFEENYNVELDVFETNVVVELVIFDNGNPADLLSTDAGQTAEIGEDGLILVKSSSDGGGTGTQGPKGDDGRSAYQVAVDDGGFVGTEIEWLATLEGNQGLQGEQGEVGPKGDQGDTGSTGPQGDQGLIGPQGIQGIQGIQGAQGITTDVIAIYMSAATGDLTAGDKASIAAPYAFTLNSFWVWVETAPTGSSLVADLKKAGVSVTTTKATIDANEFSSLTGIAPILTGDLTFAKGSKLTPNLTQAGSLETGKNLIMYLEVTKV